MRREILKFWFEEIEPSQWWKKDENLDRIITERFSEIHHRAFASCSNGGRMHTAGWLR
jgi:uncharacterized protein (DUF924 family)